MLRYIYKAVYTIGFFLTWPFWLLRDVANRKPCSFKARFLGPGRLLPKRAGRPRVWLWALSLGEVLAAKKLVPALEEAGAEVVPIIQLKLTRLCRKHAQSPWLLRYVYNLSHRRQRRR